MKKIFSEVEKSLLLLTFSKKNDISEERLDLSPEEEFLQVSSKKLMKGTIFAPHKHLELERNINNTQEAWIIMSGKIRASFYDLDDSLILKEEFAEGDCIVSFRAGHGFEVLEDNTVLYEVKNGPYFGQKVDKKFI